MTAEEAIKVLRTKIHITCMLDLAAEELEARSMAIEALEKVEEYKRLEEQGLLLRLPVALGTICYRIIFNGIHSKEKWRIEEQAFKTEDIVWIGSYVFLTREAAEAKLKEMR